MFPLGLALVAVGATVIVAPQLIAYLVGTLLIFVGANFLLVSFLARRAQRKEGGEGESSGFRFGEYEIIRKRR